MSKEAMLTMDGVVQELLPTLGELLHTFDLEHLDHVVVIDTHIR